MISTPARRCEPSFILNTFQPLRCKLAHGVPFASMRPNQPRGSIIGRNRRRDTRTRTRHTCIRACVRGWQGSGPDSAPAKSHSLSPSIPLFLFLPFFSPSASLSLSLSLHRYFRDLASALFYYYFVVISIGWLSSERRFSLQRLKSPAAVSLPRSCIAHAKILLSRRTVTNTRRGYFENLVSTNLQLDNWQSDEYYEEIVSRECDPDPGIRGGSMIFEREEGRVNGGISRQGRSESGDAAAGEGRSFPETRRSRGGEARERERGVPGSIVAFPFLI